MTTIPRPQFRELLLVIEDARDERGIRDSSLERGDNIVDLRLGCSRWNRDDEIRRSNNLLQIRVNVHSIHSTSETTTGYFRSRINVILAFDNQLIGRRNGARS